MKRHLIILLLMSLTICCKNREDEKFIKASYEVSNQNSEFDEIVTEFKTELTKIDKKYNVNNQKEILNTIINEQDFFASAKINSTKQKLAEAKLYFENIFRENDIVYESGLKKLNALIEKTKSSEVNQKCAVAIGFITTLQMNSQMYNLEVNKLIDLLGSSSNYVGNDCKYIKKNGEVLFYTDECLNKYNKLVEEVQKSQIECNGYREKINGLKIQ